MTRAARAVSHAPAYDEQTWKDHGYLVIFFAKAATSPTGRDARTVPAPIVDANHLLFQTHNNYAIVVWVSMTIAEEKIVCNESVIYEDSNFKFGGSATG